MSHSLKMAALHSFKSFSTTQKSVTSNLNGLIRACIKESLEFNVAVPFKYIIKDG